MSPRLSPPQPDREKPILHEIAVLDQHDHRATIHIGRPAGSTSAELRLVFGRDNSCVVLVSHRTGARLLALLGALITEPWQLNDLALEPMPARTTDGWPGPLVQAGLDGPNVLLRVTPAPGHDPRTVAIPPKAVAELMARLGLFVATS